MRGLLHVHPVLAYSTLAEKRGADRYLEHLDAMRRDYGFGYVERKHQVREPRAAAAYLSSYFISGKGKKISLEESVQSNWLPRSIIHVSTELTKRSGITMRSLRLRRFAWIVWRAHFSWDCELRDQITPRLIWQNFMSGYVQPAQFSGGL